MKVVKSHENNLEVLKNCSWALGKRGKPLWKYWEMCVVTCRAMLKSYRVQEAFISVSTAFLVRFKVIYHLGIPGLAGCEAGQLEFIPVHLSINLVPFVTTSQDKNRS